MDNLNRINKQILIWLGVVFALYLIHRLSSVLIPFLVSFGLAYLTNPLVTKIEKRKIPRTWAVSIVFFIVVVTILLILFIIIPLFVNQIISLVNKIPESYAWLQLNVLPKIASVLETDTLKDAQNSFRNALGSGGSLDVIKAVSSKIASSLSSSTFAIVGVVASLILIPMLTFYIMRDWSTITKSAEKLIPRSIAPQVLSFIKESDVMLSSFLRGQFTVMLVLALVYSIGLSIVGLEYSILIGVLAGLISFIPYLGASSGIAIGLIVAWFQFGDITHLILVGIVFGIGQLLESFVLTPILIGDKLGMHPIAVVFALMVGGSLFGFFGILLALPVCAVLMVALRLMYARYVQSPFYLGHHKDTQ